MIHRFNEKGWRRWILSAVGDQRKSRFRINVFGLDGPVPVVHGMVAEA
jgi:hypothetical protein